METLELLYDDTDKDFNLKQVKSEFVQLLRVISEKDYKNFMEVGSNEGGTFVAISKLLPTDGIKISLDLVGGGFGGISEGDYKIRNAKIDKLIPNSYFINKDSHSKDATVIVEHLLGDEKLDILFIDGDHTYEGVKKDYEMYSKYVRGGGIIAFHDIKDCHLHHIQNCYVNKFWQEVKGDKSEILVTQPEDWGGIGIIKVPENDYKIFQIYFDENSCNHLLSCFEAIQNATDTKYFENDVLLHLYDNLSEIKEKYIGTTSWKFRQKTGFNSLIEFEDKLRYAIDGGNQVVFFTPTEFQFPDCWKRNKQSFPMIYDLCTLIDRTNALPFKLQYTKWTSSYCNYWIAEKSVFADFIEKCVKPCIDMFEHNIEIKTYCQVMQFKHYNKPYPMYPFVLELLMGYWVNHNNIPHTTISPNK